MIIIQTATGENMLELDNPENGMVRYMNIKFDLEKLFHRSVDIVISKAIKNQRIKKYIFSNIRDIYAA
jgi:predicted nucleotidyltransferase